MQEQDKQRKKITKLCYGITAGIFLVLLLWGILGSITGNELGYSLLSFYLIMPLTSLVIGIIIGIKNGYLKWLYPFVFGIFSLLVPRIIFGSWNSFDAIELFFSFIPALVGVGIGTLIGKIRKEK